MVKTISLPVFMHEETVLGSMPNAATALPH